MDKISKLAQEHGEVFESLTFFHNALSANIADTTKKPEDYIANLSDFLNNSVIKHFKFEENEIFPTLLAIGKPEDKKLVRKLEHEHIDILDKVDQIKDYILASGFPENTDKIKMDQLVNLGMETVDMMMKHARFEDEYMYPRVKDLHIHFG